jgi:hypothetical protein
MSEYRKAVLHALGRGSDPVDWYRLEQRLSNMTIVVRERLLDALDALEANGLVRREHGSPPLYVLTNAGRRALDE